MKVLIILLTILAGVWIWRSGRDKRQGSGQLPSVGPPSETSATLPMVACRVCGVHVPSSEAFIGREGSYSFPAHRQLAEG